MEYATLSCGERMPLVGYGTYQLGGKTERCVREALACGYRSIDTAQYYGNEADVGRAIAASGVPREDLFLTTKLQSGHNVAASVEASLRKLRTDYLDLLLIHWPMGESLAIYHAMEALVRRGRVRALGLSNFYGHVYDQIIAHYAICPSVIQQETHLYLQNQERQKIYQRQGVTLEAWAPFGEGRENMFRLPLVEELAASYRRTPAQIILRFFVQQGIVVIPKTRHPNRMAENLAVFDFALSDADMRRLKRLDQERSLFGWYQ